MSASAALAALEHHRSCSGQGSRVPELLACEDPGGLCCMRDCAWRRWPTQCTPGRRRRDRSLSLFIKKDEKDEKDESAGRPLRRDGIPRTAASRRRSRTLAERNKAAIEDLAS